MEKIWDQKKVLAANYAFYAAVRFGDFEAMDALWSTAHDAAVVHPGMRELRGREAVMTFWRRIMDDGSPPDVRPKDLVAIVSGKAALVICTEDHGESQMVATNVFVKDGYAWRMTHHRASDLPLTAKVDL